MATGQLSNALRHIRQLLGGPGGSDLNDRELLARFADCRDEDAFATLVRRHGPIVLGVCRRVLDNDHDADDAFQATFLVLARKAKSVYWRESVRNWLYEVAYRTAQQAQARSTLRQKHERQAGTMHAIHSANGAGWHELRQVLDDELMHLPEKYRMPLLLCYLHGKTRDEAAEELGCSVQQLKGSLERGKEFLRSRLARRGLSLSAALLATELSSKALFAVPASLMTSTIHGAAAGGVSPSVAALTQGVMQMMFWKKFCFGMLIALTVAMVGSGAGLAVYQVAGQSKQRSPDYADAIALAPLPEEGKPLVQPGPFVITNESNGKTVSVPIGRAIEVRLAGTQAATGWETGPVKGDALLYANSGAAPDHRPTRPGLEPLPFGGEFQPQAGALDKAVGTYVFCYQAVKEGRADLNMDYITPGGPGVKQRRRSARIAEFKVTIDVTPKASKPAVKDGLSLTVRPAKAVFTENSHLEFKIALANVSPDEFFLPGMDARRLTPHYRIEIRRAGKEGMWAPRVEKKFDDNIASVRLAAAQTHEQLLSFADEHKYQWTGTDKEPHAFPAPGQYQLFVTVSVTGVENSKLKWWQGTLVSNPVEFEIAAEKPTDAKASQPAVKDGLAVTVAPAKMVYGKDEIPALEITLTNSSLKPFKLYDIGWNSPLITSLVTDMKTGGSWRHRYVRSWSARPVPVSTELAAGKSLKLEERLQGRLVGQGQSKGTDLDRLPPGKYQLVATIAFDAPKELPDHWRGEIRANPVEFEIAAEKPDGGAKASEPATKDGVSVTVRPTKATFGDGELLAFEVTYRNESKKALRLPSKQEPAPVNYWTFHFETVTEKQTYTGRCVLLMGDRPLGQPSGPLEPETLVRVQGALHNNFRFVQGAWPNETNPKGSLAALPPGRYRVRIEIKFPEEVDTTGEPPIWPSRAITTNPVEFEIAVEKPAAQLDKLSVEQLVADLDSADGAKRVAATKEIFRRGKAILKDLQKAGAKPAQTIQPPRVDMVYSLLEGSFAGRYTTGHFGIHLNPGVTRKDVNEMGKKYSFSLGEDRLFHDNGHPNCYVALAAGKSLTDVLRQILTEEPRVVTVNLNYFER
jgi:RNA polymerase sigma factor (sigma-70 family)